MKTALYARVSTTDQSAAMQLDALRKYAIARGWSVTAEYVDEGYSGAKMQRPGLAKLLDDVRKRQVDCVAVWRFDRFARSTKELLNHMDEFKALGVQFCSYTENVDTSTPAGAVLFTILAAFAQFERDLIRERVQAGVRRSIANGKTWGRKPIQFVDLPHLSLRKAARQLGVSLETVRRRRLETQGA